MDFFIHLLRGVLGMVVLIGVGYIFSANRKGINWGTVGLGLLAQLLLALGVLKVPFIKNIFEFIGGIFVQILEFTKKTGFIYNLFSVITGKKSWVGFAAGSLIIMEEGPGNLKPAVLNPADALKGITLDQPTVTRLNMLYARGYKIQNDLRILWKGIRKSGR